MTFYNALAEQAMTFKKGMNLFVEGSMQQRKFTPRDGSERTVTEIIVQSCHVIGSTAQPNGTGTIAPLVEQESEDEDTDASWPL